MRRIKSLQDLSASLPSSTIEQRLIPSDPLWGSPNSQQTWANKSPSTVPASLFMMIPLLVGTFSLQDTWLNPEGVSVISHSCSCSQSAHPTNPAQVTLTWRPTLPSQPTQNVLPGVEWEKETERSLFYDLRDTFWEHFGEGRPWLGIWENFMGKKAKINYIAPSFSHMAWMQ